MNLRSIVFLGALAAVLLAGMGIVKTKHGLVIGAVLLGIGFLLPDTASTTTGATS